MKCSRPNDAMGACENGILTRCRPRMGAQPDALPNAMREQGSSASAHLVGSATTACLQTKSLTKYN